MSCAQCPFEPSAYSRSQQSVLTSSICSGLLQRMCKQLGTRHDDREALCARHGDVQPVLVVEELDVPRQVIAARRRHRHDDRLRLLALELVDRADARARRKHRLQQIHLRVVRRHDEDVVERHRPLRCPPCRSTAAASRLCDDVLDDVRFRARFAACSRRARTGRKRMPVGRKRRDAPTRRARDAGAGWRRPARDDRRRPRRK